MGKIQVTLTLGILCCGVLLAVARDQDLPRILILSYDFVPSFHSHFMETIALNIAREYNVTWFSKDKTLSQRLKTPGSLITVIDYNAGSLDTFKVKQGETSPVEFIRKIRYVSDLHLEHITRNEALLQRVVKENYQLVLYNSMDYGAVALIHHLRIPAIQILTSGVGGVHNPLNLELTNSAPYLLSGYTELDSIKKRVFNTAFYLLDHFLRTGYFYYGVEEIAKRYGLIPADMNYHQLAADTPKKTLVYTNDAVDCSIRLPASYHRISGAFLDKAEDMTYLQTLTESSKDVIYVASGKGGFSFEHTTISKLLHVISHVTEYEFIWSLGESSVLDCNTTSLPGNLRIFRTVNQPALLANPRTKAFITVGGLGSTTEAIYYGVPILAFPQTPEHQLQANKRLIDILNMGIPFDITKHSIDHLIGAISDITNQQVHSYQQSAKAASKLFRECTPNATTKFKAHIDEVIEGRCMDCTGTRTVGSWVEVITYEVMISVSVIISLLVIILNFITRSICSATFKYLF